MIWVRGGIIVHGLKSYGLSWIAGAIQAFCRGALPLVAGGAEWLITAIGSPIVGLTIGAVLIPLTETSLLPLEIIGYARQPHTETHLSDRKMAERTALAR
jgi:hypothetical protein